MSDDFGTNDYLIFCGIGFFVVCCLVAYLLYWFVRKSKSERFSKIRFRSRKSKSLGKAVRRSKIADEKAKQAKKGKMDDEAFIKIERRTKDEASSSSSLNKCPRQAEMQEELQQPTAKASSEQPCDYAADMRAGNFKHQQGAFLMPSEYGVESAQSLSPPPPPPKIPQIRLPSEATKSSRDQSLVLVEPNKFLKEAGIGPDQEPTKDRLKSFTSRVDAGKSNLMAKKMDSVVAYQTSPISLDGNQEADITPSMLNANNAASSKFASKVTDDSNKNTTSILSVNTSQIPREASDSYISPNKSNLSASANRSNITNDPRPLSKVASSKEIIFQSTTSSSTSSRTKDPQSRRYESKRKPTN